jgi:hypothetical protein
MLSLAQHKDYPEDNSRKYLSGGVIMGKYLISLIFLVALVLSGCTQNIPNTNTPEEVLEIIEGEKTPITLQLQNPNENLQSQAYIYCTIQHGFSIGTTTIKGWGKITCPKTITYGRMRIVIYRADNTDSYARYVERPNVLTTFRYESDSMTKVIGKRYCVDSTWSRILLVNGSHGISGEWSAFCYTVR